MNGKSDPTSEPLAATFSAAPVWAASSLDRPARIALKPAPVAVATKVRRSVLGTSKPSREAVGSRFIFRLLVKFTSGQGSRCRGPMRSRQHLLHPHAAVVVSVPQTVWSYFSRSYEASF